MDTIQDTFKRLRHAHRKALIPFVMGGDPNLRTTAQLLFALEDAGADLIEVGIPFSDPLADGPIIQAASSRALHHGTTPHKIFDTIAAVRQRLRVPLVCLSYWNPIVQFGPSGHGTPTPFLRAARHSGFGGLIVPDLPVEESHALRSAALQEQMASIFLAAPTSSPARLRAIARASTGFIYYVSVIGTTGVRRILPSTLMHGIRQLKLVTTKPVCVGFGISTPQQAAMVAHLADGVIVGSALIRVIEGAKNPQAALRSASRFVKQLRQVV